MSTRAIRAVGGEFGLVEPSHRPAHSLAEHLSGRGQASSLTYLASGREAVGYWLQNEAESGRRVLLLPAYICGSVVQAARAQAAWSIVFIPVGPDLSPLPDAVVDAGREYGDNASLLAVPLFGRQYSSRALGGIAEAAALGVSVAWDITHGLFSEWSRDITPWLASLRKWCGIPDGAVASLATKHISEPDTLSSSDAFFRLRVEGLRARRDWLSAGGEDQQRFLPPLQEAEARLDQEAGVRGMSSMSRDLLASVDVAAIKERRRANAAHMLAVLDRNLVTPLLPELDDDAVPIGVPVLVTERDRVRAELRRRRIYCPVHWMLPDEITEQRFPEAHRIARQLLTIPCDERCTPVDMDEVAMALAEVAASLRPGVG